MTTAAAGSRALAATSEHDGGQRVKTRVARVQRHGKVHYLGRLPDAAARQAEAAARSEHARTGRITGSRGATRLGHDCTVHAEDAELWALGLRFAAPEELPGALRLMLAVVERTKADLASRKARERLAAERLFRSDDRSHAYAFATICDAFDVEPAAVRQAL